MVGYGSLLNLSGKRDSNPRPSAWEADALPTELLPPILRNYTTKVKEFLFIYNSGGGIKTTLLHPPYSCVKKNKKGTGRYCQHIVKPLGSMCCTFSAKNRVALRIRASSATVGARHASPVKYAVGVFSVNTLFMSCHEIIARNANYTRHNRAGEAYLVPTN